MDPELRAAIGRIARVPQLLVACDYDGTLAPIVEDPTQGRTAARVGGRGPRAGRAAADHRRGGLRPGAARPGRAVPAAQRGAPGRQPRLRVRHRLRRAARPRAGRGAHPAARRAARDRRGAPGRPAGAQAGQRRGAHPRGRPAGRRRRPSRRSAAARPPGPDVTVTQGKEVIELSVVRHPQGHRGRPAAHPALRQRGAVHRRRRHRRERLRQPARPGRRHQGRPRRDPGRTTGWPSRSRRPGCSALLLETRRHWLFGERAVPIERHSMLANGRTVALLTPDARVTWLCHPRPDSAAIFADLLGGSPAGHFTRRARARRHPAGPALPPRHDDRGDPLVRADRHRLAGQPARDHPTARRSSRRLDPDPGAHRLRPGPAGVRAAARVRPGRRAAAAARRRPAGARLQRAGRALLPRRGVGGRRRRRARDRPGRRRPLRRRRAGRCWSCASARTAWSTTGCRSTSGRPPPSSRGGTGSPRCGCPSTARDLVAAQRAHAARAVPRGRPARSWPPRPPRCRRSWAASATGTTATAGCATRR